VKNKITKTKKNKKIKKDKTNKENKHHHSQEKAPISRQIMKMHAKMLNPAGWTPQLK